MPTTNKKMLSIQKIQIRDNPNDVIYTPPSVAKLMIDMCDIQPGDRVLDPSKGGGVFYDNLPPCDKSYCEITEGIDFFDASGTYDLVIGNPPYSLWNKWIKHTIKLNPNKICYIFGCWNLTPTRMRCFRDAGYIITKFHFLKIGWWFSPSFMIVFEKGDAADELIDWSPQEVKCHTCKGKCTRGKTLKGRKYGLNECVPRV